MALFRTESDQRINVPIRTNTQRFCLVRTVRYQAKGWSSPRNPTRALAGHHQPVSTWILGSYFMGVNLSNRQIAQELGVCESDAQAMVLRHGIVATTPEVVLSGDVEFDELYVVAGHKGNPEAVRAKGRDGRRNRWKCACRRGPLEKEKQHIF